MSETVKGLEKLIKALEKAPKEVQEQLDAVVEANAQDVERDAKRRNSSGINRAYDTGTLNRSIRAYKVDNLTWRVGANTTGLAPYAPYIEFGTGGLVEVPAELRDIAIRFKGKGKRKVNLRARPYLYPALLAGRKRFLQDIEEFTERYFGKI